MSLEAVSCIVILCASGIAKAASPRLPCRVHFLFREWRPDGIASHRKQTCHLFCKRSGKQVCKLNVFFLVTYKKSHCRYIRNQNHRLQGKNWLKASRCPLRLRSKSFPNFSFVCFYMSHINPNQGAKGRFVLGIDCEMVYAKERVLAMLKLKLIVSRLCDCSLRSSEGWQGCARSRFCCELLWCHLRCLILRWHLWTHLSVLPGTSIDIFCMLLLMLV